MQFTRLRLQGFKSFVDPTEMLIEPGLTGVVGPNGCGKSNLLEALRWVMGEGRASAMRGGAMDDVIFAGATGRPARNHAEVGVILDNTARTAPTGFNDSDALEVVRRITRDVGSAYKANGREARARDVQMLFADASTGALSPALVRQGQISEIISAKPKARRRVLEEAAGISGLYQRRHEAELRLRAADANLVRLDDVLEALRGQMVALTRQARQAARYRELAEALRRAEGQLLFRRWLEAAGALEAAEAEERSTLTAVAKAEGGARAAARALEAAEAALPPKREETAIAGAIVQRLALEREALDARADRAAEAIEALDRQIAEVDADAEREAALNRDAEEVMTRLAAEERDLDDADARHPERLAGAEAAANHAATDLAEGEAALETARSTAAALSAEAAAGARRLAVAEEAVARAEKAQAAATTAATAIQAEIDAARAANETAAAAHAAAETAAATADAALATAEAAAAAAQAKESEARSEHAAAEGQARTLEAEVIALAGLIAEDRSGGGILEEVTVAPGFERALGAAFGDDLAAPRAVAGGTGWDEIAGAEAAALPAGIESLAPHVAAPAALDRRLKATGVVAQGQGTDLQRSLAPGHRLVSLEGDLWRWDGYSATAEDAPSAAAQRLIRKNRLAELDALRVETAATAKAAQDALSAAQAALKASSGDEKEARATRRAAEAALAVAGRSASQAEAALTTLTARRQTLEEAVIREAEAVAAVTAARDEARAAAVDPEALAAAEAKAAAARAAVDSARVTASAATKAAEDRRREAQGRARRRERIAREREGWRRRQETAEARSAEVATRRADAVKRREAAAAEPAVIADLRDTLAGTSRDAAARRARAEDALAEAEAARQAAQSAARAAEAEANQAREARARAEARREAGAAAAAEAEREIRAAHDLAPRALGEALGAEEGLPPAQTLEAEIARFRRSRDALGAINLRAEEDMAEVSAEAEALGTEKADLEQAIAKLRQGIQSLNREGRSRLLAAFDEVNGHFAMLFKALFGGGEANLVMVESDDPLEAGLEIMCQPPGKKLATLSLLSGGEQTLTALSLIFAVFLANPAPICVLDEVDAPLDDANVTRFCGLLDRMVDETATRFLIITHHAVTMSRMDRLYGVTMAEPGVSQLVSVDLRAAEALVDA